MSKFFTKLKGPKDRREDLQPDPSSSFSSNNPYNYIQSQPPEYQPPSGPPPLQKESSRHQQIDTITSAPNDNPPPYHDWTSVPDTALLPPPPALTNDYSSATNASYDEAAAAHAWCARNPVYTPSIPNAHLVETVQAGQHNLDPCPGFHGTIRQLNPTTHASSFTPNFLGATPSTVLHLSTASKHTISTPSKSRFLSSSNNPSHTASPTDQTHLTRLPLYFASVSSPLLPRSSHQTTPQPVTVYFEIRPLRFATEESTISLGFASKPYPPNRQPGWHRASLAVHSDDGNRYVNDPWGGREFTCPFQPGETLGIAMVLLPEKPEQAPTAAMAKQGVQSNSDREVRSGLPRCKTKVYFVRDGKDEGGWDVDEERDAERDEGIAGLLGEVDLYAAVGTYGDVEVEVRFFGSGDGFVAPPRG